MAHVLTYIKQTVGSGNFVLLPLFFIYCLFLSFMLPPMVESAQLSLHEWACLRPELVWIYDDKVRPENRARTYVRKRANWAWYLRKGEASLSTDSQQYHIREGMWLFVPEGLARQHFSMDAQLLSLHFVFQWPSGENVIKDREGLLLKGTDFPQLEKRAVHLNRLVRHHFPDSSYRIQRFQPISGPSFLRFQTAFLSWVEAWLETNFRLGGSLTRLGSGDDRPLLAARCLNEAALDKEYPRAQLLRETGLSEVHLNRLFLREFDLSPRKYWDRRKIEFAKNCLETSLMRVKEVSYRLGFRSDAHFVVWFRRLTGQSPSEYRMSDTISLR